MGLDMYLSAEKYHMGALDKEPNSLTRAVENVIDTKGYQVKSIRIWAGDWRKANQIHAWFVGNIQGGDDNCGQYYVSIESLRDLVNDCQAVLDDHSKAEELLPTQEGFFFGDTGYNEYYFADLKYTIEMLTPFITDEDWLGWDFYYQSSW